MTKDIDKEIVEWSIQTFPDLTVDKQRQKLNEELKEFKECQTEEEALKEGADIYIVCRILADRFDDEIGKYFTETILNEATETRGKEIKEAIEAKMEKNKARNWQKTKDGVYHHTENTDE